MADLSPLVALGVVLVMFVLFVLERYPPEVTALAAVAVLLATGVLETPALLGVLANSAPATIAAMFVLSAALVRTGVLAALVSAVRARARHRPAVVVPAVLGATMLASAFVNNTPVVMVLIPLMVGLGEELGRSPSRLLIPLSYAAILGGTCTLIGTSTNLLVDGVARDAGLPGFGLFAVTPVGIAVALVGAGFMALFGHHLLPERPRLRGLVDGAPRPLYLTEVLVNAGSPLVGKALDEIVGLTGGGVQVIDVVRDDYSQRNELDRLRLMPRDRIVLQSEVADIVHLKSRDGLLLGGQVSPVGARAAVLIEALVTPRSRLVGRTLRSLRLRRRYGLYVLAVHRHGEDLTGRLADLEVEAGDTLLVEGNPQDLRRFADETGLVYLNEPTERPYRRDRAWIAAATLAGVVVLAAFDVMPIVGLAVIGVAVVLLTRCLDAEEAFTAVDWRILVLILAMLAVGQSLVDSGAVALLVDAALPVLAGLPPIAVLALVFLLVSALTEVVTNNGVAVVVTPVVIALARELGLDPVPFVIAVMIGASCSFATPIGYQTNTLVYGPGGYRFRDFLVVGLPMNALAAVTAVLVIPLVWPLAG